MSNHSLDELFIEYLSSEGVVVSENYNSYKKNNISNQLRVISKFHKIAAGYRQYERTGLKDNIGKDIEKSKIEIKKFKKLLQFIKLKGSENIFEETLLSGGSDIIEKAKRALRVSESEEYLDIVKRSMDRGEVCLGEPSFNNIWEGNNINIRKINKCSYNILESDGIAFFRMLKRKGYSFNLSRCIDEYCILEKLNHFSREYISSLMLYPYYTIRYCIRYKDNKYNYSELDYLKKFNKVQSYDS